MDRIHMSDCGLEKEGQSIPSDRFMLKIQNHWPEAHNFHKVAKPHGEIANSLDKRSLVIQCRRLLTTDPLP